MDPLSIAAAVSGFLGLAGKIATTLKNYVDGVQSAPDEVQSLHLEVAALCQVLKDLMVFLQKDDLCGRKFESSSVLFKAIKACQYRLEELRGKLADLSEACLNKKLPGWIKRIKWPLKKDEVQQTMVALRSFAQIFQFSIVANNCELVSKTSSAMILQLDENRQGIEKLAAGLEAHSVSVSSKLKQQMSEISEIKTLVTELSQFNMEVVHNIPLGMSEIQERLQDNEFRQIMPLISPLEPHRRHQDIWQKRLEGTGNWFLLETEFQKWRDNESDDGSICSILACSGIPGAGKSVVCSIVFNHLETKFASEELVCVACLYCDYQEEKKQTPANMIGVLLNQVISALNKARLLPSDIISKLKELLNEQKSVDLGEACRLLGKTVKHLRRFYVCIDALDECNERHRRDFIQSLAKVSSECRQPTVIRIFFTSRPHIKWKELMNRYSRLGPLDHICLKAQPEDIRVYISHEIDIDENGDCMNEKLRSEILDTIVANSDGMFLLAALQIQTVLDETTISTRRSTLYNMPTKLETAFESTIARIKNQKFQRSKQAMEVLKWTFLATRPLTVDELRHALSITIDPGKMQVGHLPLVYDKTLDWDNFPSEKSLMDWCLGLIVIDEETSTVRLVHKSLHDFLTQLYEDGEIFQDGHNEIAYTCLRYMLFNDDQHEIDTVQQRVSEDIKVLRRRTFCLLDYATSNFRYHLRDQGGCAAEMINAYFQNRINLNCISTGYRSAFLSPFNGWREQIHSEKDGYITTNRMHFRLQFAVSCGLENVFRSFLEASGQAIDFNTRLGGSTMLLQASRIGQDGIVRMLLERRIDVNQADCNGLTALSWASSMGHDSIVKQLIQADSIDINSHDRFLRTALSWACLKGHDSVVKLLLQADGVDINSRDDAGQKALSLASVHGHDSVVKLLLLADSIEINSKDRTGRSPLSSASAMGHDSIVKLLIQADGIDINSKDNGGLTAFLWACLKGHDSVVRMLLQADGIDINSKGHGGQTALLMASRGGHDQVVKLLLQAGGMNINSEVHGGQTALLMASRGGHDRVVKLLLQADGIYINSKDENGCTALSWASENGHESVVKLLLQANNINISSRNYSGETALSLASKNGHESVVELFRDYDNESGHDSDAELFQDSDSDIERRVNLIRRRYRAADKRAYRALEQLLSEFDFTDTRSQDANCSSASSMSPPGGYDSVLELPELYVTDGESEGHDSQLSSSKVSLHGYKL